MHKAVYMRALILVLAVVACAAGFSVPALAGPYPGWSDTGFSFYSKRECCQAAIALAHDDSAGRCLTAGGAPRASSGVRRGRCESEWLTDAGGRRVFRCVAQASVWCG
jgi:hypothetical protein